MNEEIFSKLHYHSGLVAQGCWNELDAYDQSAIQKFGNLVVKECIDTLEKRFMGDLNREDMEVRRCIDALKQHFGDINE
jgi:hypothetical protein